MPFKYTLDTLPSIHTYISLKLLHSSPRHRLTSLRFLLLLFILCTMSSTGIRAAPLVTAAADKVSQLAASSTSPLVIRRSSSSRGHANHGWLNTYHTFSFANWYDPRYEQLHALRVINEDRVAPGRGFGKHPHREFEIFSYVVSGALRHSDSMGHVESIGRGAVQFTSAGTGIQHAEENFSDKENVHFLQLWVKPNVSGLKPSYTTRKWTDEDKAGKFALICTPDGRDGSITLHADVNFLASIVSPGQSVSYQVQPGRELYAHLIQDASGFDTEYGRTALTIAGANGELSNGASPVHLNGGDGALIKHSGGDRATQPETVVFTGAGVDGAKAEFVLFDLKKL
jgi:redox-sensitive bicupin YhaK (pirin superfamily)